MQALLKTSFDRYARYSYIDRLRRTAFGDGPLRILDVGDPYGTLAPVFPDDDTVSLDLFHDGAPATHAHAHVIGSGFTLPFADSSFDLVASHDAFEHIPVDAREIFVTEMLRVSRGPVLLVAPFHDPRTARCEEIINAFYVARVGTSLAPLDEHADGGLPLLQELLAWADANDETTITYSDGWLYHWLAFMLLKAHYVSVGAARLDRATDEAFNALLRERDGRSPHYRRAVLFRPPADAPPPSLPDAPDEATIVRDIRAIDDLALQLMRALPRTEDPSAPTSSFRTWAEAASHRPDDVGELGRSLTSVLERAEQATATSKADLTRPDPIRQRVSAVVVAEQVGDLTRLRQLLDGEHASSFDLHVTVVTDSTLADEPIPPQWTRVVQQTDDWLLRTNHGIDAVDAEFVLLLDPTGDFPTGFLRSLFEHLDVEPDAGVVGFLVDHDPSHRANGPAPSQTPPLHLTSKALLCRRDLYRNTGGFDGSFRRQLDDLDFCWRVRCLGYKVVSVGVAAVDAPPPGRRFASLLRSMVKNLEPANVHGCVAALITAAVADLDPGELRAALDLVSAELTQLLDARAFIQSLRRVGDAEILGLGWTPVPEPVPSIERLLEFLLADTRIARDAVRDGNTLVIASPDRTDRAIALASAFDEAVLVVEDDAPGGVDRHPGKVIRYTSDRDLEAIARHAQVVVVGADVLERLPRLASIDGALVVDVSSGQDGNLEEAVYRRARYFLCGSEAQRTYWLGRLRAFGRPTAREQRHDPTGRSFIDVWGDFAHTDSTSSAARVIKGVDRRVLLDSPLVVLDLDGIGPDLSLAQSVIELFGAIAAKYPLARLCIVAAPGTRVAEALRQVAERPSLEPVVVVGQPMTAEVRAQLLREADLVVRPAVEDGSTVLGSLQPALDATMAGVPIVATPHDPGAELVAAHNAGVLAIDAATLQEAIDQLLGDEVAAAVARRGALRSFAHHSRPPASLRDLASYGWRPSGEASPEDTILQLDLQRKVDEQARELAELQLAARDIDDRETLAAMLFARTEEATRLQRHVSSLEAELRAHQVQLQRISGHPAFRLLSRIRRFLLST